MKTSSIAVTLDTRRERKDGTYPVILRLSHNGKTTSIKTGIHLKKTDWDTDARMVKKSAAGVSNVTRVNNELQKKKAEALDSILKLGGHVNQPSFSVTDLKTKISPTSNGFSFYEYSEKLVKELKKAERIGTARSYEGTLSVLKTFNKGRPLQKNLGGNPNVKILLPHKGMHSKIADLSFEELNYTFLKKFEVYHLSNGNGLNGLAVYLRTMRAIYNQAINEGIAERIWYPFEQYKIKTVPTKKRALEADWLQALLSLKLTPTDTCFNERNYFIASYMMYGMNFADMAHLKKSDISNGRIQYRRRKTSKLYDIKISETLHVILSHYMQENVQSPFVFPIIKRDGAILQSRDIQWARKRYNKKLKVLATLCEIPHTLTSYVSRHSFATQAMLNNIPLAAISAMLGHSSLKTTEIYLKSLPTDLLDTYNQQLLGTLNF